MHKHTYNKLPAGFFFFRDSIGFDTLLISYLRFPRYVCYRGNVRVSSTLKRKTIKETADNSEQRNRTSILTVTQRRRNQHEYPGNVPQILETLIRIIYFKKFYFLENINEVGKNLYLSFEMIHSSHCIRDLKTNVELNIFVSSTVSFDRSSSLAKYTSHNCEY